jgi:hypothetical protein
MKTLTFALLLLFTQNVIAIDPAYELRQEIKDLIKALDEVKLATVKLLENHEVRLGQLEKQYIETAKLAQANKESIGAISLQIKFGSTIWNYILVLMIAIIGGTIPTLLLRAIQQKNNRQGMEKVWNDKKK